MNLTLTSTFSYSRLSTVQKCLFEFFAKYHKGWEPAIPNVHLGFGKAFHAASVPVWVEGNSGHGRSLNTAIETSRDTFMETWEGLGLPIGNDILLAASWLKQKTPMAGLRIMEAYAKERWDFLATGTLLWVELPFLMPLGTTDPLTGEQLYFRGILDRHWMDHHGERPWELKTTSMGGPNGFYAKFTNSFNPNAQIQGYSVGFEDKFPGRAKEVVVDAALVHDKHTKFMAQPVSVSSERQEQWRKNTKALMADVRRRERACNTGEYTFTEAFPQNLESCQGKYGPCQFYDMCKFTLAEALHVMDEPPAGYVPMRWDEEDPFSPAALADSTPPVQEETVQ